MMQPSDNNRLRLTTSVSRRRAFFPGVDIQPALIHLLDRIPHTYFFVKDLECRLVYANQPFLSRMGVASCKDIFKKRSVDIDPLDLAEKYERDDREVMSSGIPMIDQLELNRASTGSADWLLVSKFPLVQTDGCVVGLVGLALHFDRAHAKFEIKDRLSRAVDWIHNHLDSEVKVDQLAALAGMSRRSFEEHFFQTMNSSPARYLARARLSRACDALKNSSKPVCVVAQESGFYDQSALTKAFKKHFGMTPAKFRLQ